MNKSLIFAFALLLACGDDDAGDDAGSDAGADVSTADVAVSDAGVDSAPDAGTDGGTDAAADAGRIDAGPPGPSRFCPGSAGCMEPADGALMVGAAAVDITPTIDDTTEVMTLDNDGDGEFDEGDEFRDTNGDGVFDGVWVAGFGNARPANGVSDPQWARAVVMRNGDTTIALVSLDVVGFFFDDVVEARMRLSDADLDYLGVMSTHTHEARDTIGQWGPALAVSGVDLTYMDTIYEAIAQSVREAIASLEPANIEYATTFLRDQPGGVRRYVSDSRDPQVIDDEVRILRFLRAGTDETIATLINLASHPEYAGDENGLLSSDFAHGLREGVENGASGPAGELPGVGGIALFFNGAVGSQIGPNDLDSPQTFDGTPLPSETLEQAHGIGDQFAYFVLRALEESTREETAALAFRSRDFEVEVENVLFHLGFNLGIFPTRSPRAIDPDEFVSEENPGFIQTEVAVVDVGRARLLLVPGELDPALFVGGYDGMFAPTDRPVVNGERVNPPDLGLAPSAPYMRERAEEDFDYVFLFGLANDELGYLIPRFDFELDPDSPYWEEAPGDHYEETVSIGPNVWPDIERQMHGLLDWTAP